MRVFQIRRIYAASGDANVSDSADALQRSVSAPNAAEEDGERMMVRSSGFEEIVLRST